MGGVTGLGHGVDGHSDSADIGLARVMVSMATVIVQTLDWPGHGVDGQ